MKNNSIKEIVGANPPSPLILPLGPTVKVLDRFIQYDLESSKGFKIEFPHYEISSETLSVELRSELPIVSLLFKWPLDLFPEGFLEIVGPKNKIVWSSLLTSVDLIKNKPYTYQIVIKSQENDLLLKGGEGYSFCLTRKISFQQSKLCTPLYIFSNDKEQFLLKTLQIEDFQPEIKIQNKKEPLKGKYQIKEGEFVYFSVQLADQTWFSFECYPVEPKISSIYEEGDQDLLIQGEWPLPLIVESKSAQMSLAEVQEDAQLSPITGKGLFLDSYGFPQRLWKVKSHQMKKVRDKSNLSNQIVISYPGSSGGIFSWSLDILPSKAINPKEKVNSGEKQKNIALKKEDILLAGPSKEEAPLSFSYFQNAQSPHSVKKAFPLDISAGIALAVGGKSANYLSHANFSYWFEKLFGWDSSIFSFQRWGVGAKVLNTFFKYENSVSEDRFLNPIIQAQTFDLRYRFQSGAYDWQETFGLIFSYENLYMNDYHYPKFGYGLFWARNMPLIFDRLFNIIPFFRYNKYVFMEFIQYTNSMDSSISLKKDRILNFDGKLFWTPRSFFELGFGIKDINFYDAKVQTEINLFILYGNIGLGYKF